MPQFYFNAASMSQFQYNLDRQYNTFVGPILSSLNCLLSTIEKAKETANEEQKKKLEEYEAKVQEALNTYQEQLNQYYKDLANYNPNPPSTPPPADWTPPEPPVPPEPPTIDPPPELDLAGIEEQMTNIVNSINSVGQTANEIREAADSIHKSVETCWEGEGYAWNVLKSFSLTSLVAGKSVVAQNSIASALYATEVDRIKRRDIYGDETIIQKDFTYFTFTDEKGNKHTVNINAYTSVDKAERTEMVISFAKLFGADALLGLSLKLNATESGYKKFAKAAGVKAYANYADLLERREEVLESHPSKWSFNDTEAFVKANEELKAEEERLKLEALKKKNPNYAEGYDIDIVSKYIDMIQQHGSVSDSDLINGNFRALKGNTIDITAEDWNTIWGYISDQFNYKYSESHGVTPGQNWGTDCSGLVCIAVNAAIDLKVGNEGDTFTTNSDGFSTWDHYGVALDVDWSDPDSYNNLPVGTVIHWNGHVAIVTKPGYISEQYDTDKYGHEISLGQKINGVGKPDGAYALFNIVDEPSTESEAE